MATRLSVPNIVTVLLTLSIVLKMEPTTTFAESSADGNNLTAHMPA
eukprot:CAMPEP_0117590080 /NCGR_PEP_ID=MMETSP0784-20121206/70777_1 /TAXON_ID=39447 /ORGANISM="" /LENGTH=45 /DNA_ID= /DNA_START= /DNA_END= /DNA_ORIENTATION=